MTTLKRAFLYITRKKGRSIILFVLIFVVAVFSLMGTLIAIESSKQAEAFKASLACGFTVEPDFDPKTDGSLQEAIIGEDGTIVGVRFLTPVEINDELVETIASVEEIDAYNAQFTYFAYTHFENKKGSTPKLIEDMKKYPPEMKEDLGTENDIKMSEIHMQYVTTYGTTQSDLHPFFLNGALTLSEGRHITADDKYTVVISRDMAQRNNASIGDMMPFELLEEDIELTFNANTVPYYLEAEIVGIYDMNFIFEDSAYTVERNIPENYVFMDLTTAKEIVSAYGDPYTYERVSFYVDDPAKLNTAVSAVRETDLPWAYLKIVRDDISYQAMTDPLDALTGFSSLMLCVAAGGGFLVLFLLIYMWLKARTKEIYIMRSIGINKNEIKKQMIYELLFIAVIAFMAALIVSIVCSGSIGESFERIIFPEIPVGENYVMEYDSRMFGVLTPVTQTDVDISYNMSSLSCFIAGALIIFCSVCPMLFASKKLLNKPLCDLKNNIR